MIHGRKALGFQFNNLQKVRKFAKILIFIAKSNFLAKICKNEKCSNYDKLYIGEYPLTQQIQICKNICKTFKPKVVFKKNKNSVLIYAKFLCRNCAICFPVL